MEKTFAIEYFKSTDLAFTINNKSSQVIGFGDTKHIDAENRVAAYLKFRQMFDGEIDIFSHEIADDTETPLGFSEEEIKQVEELGIVLLDKIDKPHIHILSILPL